MKDAQSLAVVDPSSVAVARRAARALTASFGFTETAAGRVALIVTEAASNILKHAGSGEVLLKTTSWGSSVGVEILALDKGPGMVNVAQCMRDGFSTSGGSGTGLGAMSRLSDLFDIFSAPRQGTAVFSRVWAGNCQPKHNGSFLEVDTVCLPIPSEEISGDGWAVSRFEDHCLLMVCDGLGHGPLAADAAIEAIKVFNNNTKLPPAEIIGLADPALHGTRGAAMMVAQIDFRARKVVTCGVGNISGAVISPEKTAHLVSSDGIVGEIMGHPAEFSYEWGPQSVFVMHSDGMSSHWTLDRYPGITARHPALIAGVLYRDYNKRHDDVTVMAASSQAGNPDEWKRMIEKQG